MDFYGGLVFLPYTRLFQPSHQFLLSNLEIYENTGVNKRNASRKESNPIYNLFYDGTWQKPIKNNYWMHDKCLWANATMYISCLISILAALIFKFKMCDKICALSFYLLIYYYREDSSKCIQSAEQGFKIWSTWSVESRQQILYKFVDLLKINVHEYVIKKFIFLYS